ncbi:MAG: hypothetical protein RMM51_06485 [Verrucomicrobiae bacterium]|nr:hypothetical protein [Verrucomicrobiae bacterium]
MKYLNSTSTGPLGQGLGLEITSSMFFYSVNPHTFAYFNGYDPDSPVSSYGSRIAEYLQAGWIDTNHSFGDFDAAHPFRRAHAERAYAALAELRVTLPVYTDHGGEHNLQNIGPGSPRYHHGDVRGSPYYHADLMKRHGVRYVWSDSDTILITDPDAIAGTTPLHSVRRRFGRWRRNPQCRLIIPYRLQDSSEFFGFIRLRATGINAPNLSSLGFQLKQIDWPAFYAHHGVVIIYQHLGVLHRCKGQCRPISIEAVRQRPEVYLAPFRFLQRESAEGRLWVAGVARLLDYLNCVENVRLRFVDVDGTTNIELLTPAHNPMLSLQGLTIYIDPSRPVRVRHQGRDMPLVFNGPDETRQYSVSIPIQPLPQIW